MELYKKLHPDLQNAKLLIARVTQTSIKKIDETSAKLLETGHVLSFIGHFENSNLCIAPDSIVSKTGVRSAPTGLETKKAHFECLDEIQLISQNTREEYERIGSNEFYLFSSVDSLRFLCEK